MQKYLMNDTPSKVSWFEHISTLLSRKPEDREQLLALLHSAYERNLLDADALTMIEGVMQVSEMQVRDVMIPRSQMDTIDINERPDEFIPFVIETAHSRFRLQTEVRIRLLGFYSPKICYVIMQVRRNSMCGTCCARWYTYLNPKD